MTANRVPERSPGEVRDIAVLCAVLWLVAGAAAVFAVALAFVSDACGDYGPTCSIDGIYVGMLIAFFGPIVIAVVATVFAIVRTVRRRARASLFLVLGFPAIIVTWIAGAVLVSISSSVPLNVMFG